MNSLLLHVLVVFGLFATFFSCLVQADNAPAPSPKPTTSPTTKSPSPANSPASNPTHSPSSPTASPAKSPTLSPPLATPTISPSVSTPPPVSAPPAKSPATPPKASVSPASSPSTSGTPTRSIPYNFSANGFLSIIYSGEFPTNKPGKCPINDSGEFPSSLLRLGLHQWQRHPRLEKVIPSSSATPANSPAVFPSNGSPPRTAPASISPETAQSPVGDDSGSFSKHGAPAILMGLSFWAAMAI
ncbi:vegetative cell wall protein gp1-like [Quillaja saponaria]|uniref:Vegetative cell wall protein gp1-like n=1 Tax=Quillaja saponaria TaxID=32244 RepID=A0AAD7LSQ0_QUISA|nr:vegetative cell wall protein gp1-like [Quillaja saponaria]